jgi:hypothetical protein
LHQRLGTAERPAAGGAARPARAVNHWHWLAPAAAAVAIVTIAVLWPRPAPRMTRVVEVSLEPYSVARDRPTGGFRTGDAFVLRLRLDHPGTPVVIHVDPRGNAALLYPDPAGAAPPPFPAGEITLPPPGDDLRWSFEGDPGEESFLVTAAPARGAGLGGVPEALDAIARQAGGREARIAAIGALLDTQFGGHRRLDAEHLP